MVPGSGAAARAAAARRPGRSPLRGSPAARRRPPPPAAAPAGRPQKGQLGHGDTLQRNVPTKVAGLAGKFVVKGEPTGAVRGRSRELCAWPGRAGPEPARRRAQGFSSEPPPGGAAAPLGSPKAAAEAQLCSRPLLSRAPLFSPSLGRQEPHRGGHQGRPVLCVRPQHAGPARHRLHSPRQGQPGRCGGAGPAAACRPRPGGARC
jgi:hypothetical protein